MQNVLQEYVSRTWQKNSPPHGHPLFPLYRKLHLCIWHRMISTKIFSKCDSTPYRGITLPPGGKIKSKLQALIFQHKPLYFCQPQVHLISQNKGTDYIFTISVSMSSYFSINWAMCIKAYYWSSKQQDVFCMFISHIVCSLY